MMIKLKSLLENSISTYDYGCVMLYFDFSKIRTIHHMIKKDDLYEEKDDKTYGLEDEPHCTLLYGLHEGVTDKQIKTIIDSIQFDDCRTINISLFENDKYDVLKYDVGYAMRRGSFLHKANRKLKELPYTSDYPDYNPHMTVCYLKPGLGNKYVKLFKETDMVNFILPSSHIVYSKPDGSKTRFEV